MRKEDIISGLDELACLIEDIPKRAKNITMYAPKDLDAVRAAIRIIRANNPSEEGEYPQNLLLKLCIVIPDSEKEWVSKNIDEALLTLTEREQKVITHRYKENLSLKEVGKKYGVTQERIRQIEAKAIRKLRHPSRSRLITTGAEEIRKIEEIREALAEEKRSLAEEILKVREACEILRATGIPNPYALEVAAGIIEEHKNNTSIKDLRLSARSYNALYRAGIRTLSDLCDIRVSDLARVRNLGSKSLTEVLTRMEEHDIPFKKDQKDLKVRYY